MLDQLGDWVGVSGRGCIDHANKMRTPHTESTEILSHPERCMPSPSRTLCIKPDINIYKVKVIVGQQDVKETEIRFSD